MVRPLDLFVRKCGNNDFLQLCMDILAQENTLRFHAIGKSMAPCINDGDLVEVTAFDVASVCPNDIILYRASWGKVVAHRLLKIYDDNGTPMVITKGDSISVSDPPIRVDQVLGCVKVIQLNKK